MPMLSRRRTLAEVDLALWGVLTGFFLVALVVAVVDGDDGWLTFMAALWLVISGVLLLRTLRSRQERQQRNPERLSSEA